MIETLTLKDGTVEILGSQALTSQQFAADYDLFQTVALSYKNANVALTQALVQFQRMVRNLLQTSNLFIGDIKAGEVEDWKVVEGHLRGSKVVGYNAARSRAKADQLLGEGVLTEGEFKEVQQLLVDHPTPKQFVEAKQAIKYNVIRWKPEDILKGGVTLRTGKTYSLMEAFLTEAPVKVDVVALVDGDYRDFSCIYQFSHRGVVFNRFDEDPLQSIQESADEYLAQGNYFKAAKRLFSLAKIKGDVSRLGKLNTILNSDLGRLYGIASDVGTLLFLLENHHSVPSRRLADELESIRVRLGNVYSVDVNTVPILKDIMRLEELPTRGKEKQELIQGLEHLLSIFEKALSVAARKRLRSERLL